MTGSYESVSESSSVAMETSETLADVRLAFPGICLCGRFFNAEDVAGDLVRLELEATDDGVVDRGGIESLRPLPRLPAPVGVLAEVIF